MKYVYLCEIGVHRLFSVPASDFLIANIIKRYLIGLIDTIFLLFGKHQMLIR